MDSHFQRGAEDSLCETLVALNHGEDPELHFEVIFDDSDDIHHVTRPKNREPLRTIVQHTPASIRETARLVNRDVRQVQTNLDELEALHLLATELVCGQAKVYH